MGRSDENAIELDSGNKYTTLKVYEVLLDCNLKKNKIYDWELYLNKDVVLKNK